MFLEIIAQFWYFVAFFLGFFVWKKARRKEIKKETKPYIIGHKGSYGEAEQNTKGAFQKALEIGVDYIECDVRRSSDGFFFLAHDDKIMTKEKKKILISKTNSGDLMKMVLKKGAKLSSMKDYIEMMPASQKLYFDLKIYGSEFEFLSLLRKYKLISKCIITSSYIQSLRLLKVLEPNLMVGVSFPRDRFSIFIKMLVSPLVVVGLMLIKYTYPFYIGMLANYARADIVVVQYRFVLSSRLVKAAHKRGLLVFAFSVNTPKGIKRMIKWGVDGIASDFPDRVKQIVKNCELRIK